MRDIVNNIGIVTAIAPAVLAATQTPAGIDLAGFNSAAFVFTTGAIVGAAVFVPKLQESDDNATFTDVAACRSDRRVPGIARRHLDNQGRLQGLQTLCAPRPHPFVGHVACGFRPRGQGQRCEAPRRLIPQL